MSLLRCLSVCALSAGYVYLRNELEHTQKKRILKNGTLKHTQYSFFVDPINIQLDEQVQHELLIVNSN